MASESSFDIVAQFDLQELRNAIDQVKREISTRYDFKGLPVQVNLTDDDITLLVPDGMKLQAVKDMIIQKVINRKLSPKILEFGDPQEAAGGSLRVVVKLLKVLDQETCKIITKLIKENFPKVKTNIQGTTVRVSSKSKDELQAVIVLLREQDFKVPAQFTNYR